MKETSIRQRLGGRSRSTMALSHRQPFKLARDWEDPDAFRIATRKAFLLWPAELRATARGWFAFAHKKTNEQYASKKTTNPKMIFLWPLG